MSGERGLMRGRMAVTLGLSLGLLAPLGCAQRSMRRALRKGDLATIQAAPPERRAGFSPTQSRRYAQLLHNDGQVYRAQAWWLGAYLRGGDLEALEALATSEAIEGQLGFAAAHFSQILATSRGVLRDRALACRLWQQRMQVRARRGDAIAAIDDALRLRGVCSARFQEELGVLRSQAKVEAARRAEPPPLLYRFSSALRPAFLEAVAPRASAVPLSPPAGRLAAQSSRDELPSQVILSGLEDDPELGGWLQQAAWTQRDDALARMLGQVESDINLGNRSAAYTALLAAGGHQSVLARLRDKLRASSALQSPQSARFRVLLALGEADREQAIFWMRLGASEMQDLGAWWLWCARWAELMQQRAAAKVAYQALAMLVAPQSSARWTLSWWRLRQRIFDLREDPYLREDAPSDTARASLRALWTQFVGSLPRSAQERVWPATVDELVLRGWSDAEIVRAGILLFGVGQRSRLRAELLRARAMEQGLRADPELDLDHPSVTRRGAAWRQLWAQQGINPQSLARYWARFVQDPAFSPRVDPLAALSVLFPKPPSRLGRQ